MATRLPLPPADDARTAEIDGVVTLSWGRFLTWFRDQWKPGEHVALIGPTGAGKSTFAVGILPLRRYVMALDPKGGDSTLARLAAKGFERVESWPPPRDVWRRVQEGEPVRLIVGPVVNREEDRPRLRAAMAAALTGAFETGGWTVYVDELQVAADPRLMKLSAQIENNLIAARDKGVSMVTSFQRPARVPRAASEMSTWLAFWRTRDIDTVNRLAEMAGRSKAEIRGAVKALESKTILLFSQDPDQPIVVTRAPRV